MRYVVNMKITPKIFFAIFAIASFLLGIFVVFERGYNHHGIFIDLSKSYITVSVLFFVISIIFLFLAYREKIGANYDSEKNYMCSECLKPFSENQITDDKCPICGSKVENLKGFYDRHPNLKGST